jgi:hypothetical protein
MSKVQLEYIAEGVYKKVPKSTGFGDTIAKFTKATGIKYVVDKISEATNTKCGCPERQEALNDPKLLINKTFYKN